MNSYFGDESEFVRRAARKYNSVVPEQYSEIKSVKSNSKVIPILAASTLLVATVGSVIYSEELREAPAKIIEYGVETYEEIVDSLRL